MLAFVNTIHTKPSAVALATWHQEQDSYIRQTYGEATPEGWKGCMVGCLAEGSNHAKFPELFGIDTRIAYLSDTFFENITDYKSWPVKLISSVKEGIDTTNAWYRFMHWMLMDNQHGVVKVKDTPELRAVGKLFERAIAGDMSTAQQWRDAAYTAAAAAYAAANAAADATFAAAYAAAYAVYAAAYAANAAANAANAATRKRHYEIMADKLCYFLGGGV